MTEVVIKSQSVCETIAEYNQQNHDQALRNIRPPRPNVIENPSAQIVQVGRIQYVNDELTKKEPQHPALVDSHLGIESPSPDQYDDSDFTSGVPYT